MRVPPPLRWLMVGWHHLYRLLRTRIAVAPSAIFGCYPDHHLIKARDQRMRSPSTRYTAAVTAALCLLVLAGCSRERARLRYTSGLQPIPTADMVTHRYIP
jgi:hypothetical protein